MPLFRLNKSLTTLLVKLIFTGSIFLLSAGNVLAALQVTKTIDPVSPSPAAEAAAVRYNITVTNTGPGVLNNVIIDDLPSNLNNLNYTVTSPSPPPNSPGPGANQYRFNSLAAGQSVTLNLDTTVNAVDACPVINNTASVSENSGVFTDSAAAPSIEYDFQFTSGQPASVVAHNTLSSFCELCGDGTVSITIQNPTTAPLMNISLVEDLQASGLEYIPGTTTTTLGTAADPSISGTQLSWTSA